MAYLGRPASTGTTSTPTRDTFTGDGTVDFTLSRSVKDNNGNFLEVFVSNVQQEPGVTYSVSDTTLTFTTAPDVGESIYVVFRDYDVFNIGTIPDGSITATRLASDAVETAKIKNLNVTTGKLAANAVTQPKLAADAVQTPQIADGNVTLAKLASGTFPVNAANLASDAVTTVKILDDAVTSPKMAPIVNLQEDILITASAAIANVSINVLENSVRYFTSSNDKNFCINVRGNDSSTLNSLMETGNTITTALIVTNGATAYFASNTQVDNVLVVPKVQGGSALSEGNASSTDIYTITVLKTGDAAFTMFLSQTQYA